MTAWRFAMLTVGAAVAVVAAQTGELPAADVRLGDGVAARDLIARGERVRERRVGVVIEGEPAQAGVHEVLGVVGLRVLDDRDRAALDVDERALDGLAGSETEGGGASCEVAVAVAVVAGDRAEIERRRRVVLGRGVRAREQVVELERAAVADGARDVAGEDEAAGRAIRLGLLLDDDLAELGVGERAGDVFVVADVDRRDAVCRR